MNVYQSFVEVAKRYRGRPAVIYLGEVLTYGDLFEAVDVPFDGIAVAWPQRTGQDNTLHAQHAAVDYQLAFHPEDRGDSRAHCAYLHVARPEIYCDDSGARTVICADTNFGYAKELKEEGTLDHLIVSGMADLLPLYKRLIGKAFDRIPEGKIEKGPGIARLTDLMKKREMTSGAAIDEKEPLEMLYTGGTTKNPKGVPISHALFLDSVTAQLEISYPLIPPSENVILQGGPLFHILGQVFGVGPFCVTGDCVIIMPKVNIDAYPLCHSALQGKNILRRSGALPDDP